MSRFSGALWITANAIFLVGIVLLWFKVLWAPRVIMAGAVTMIAFVFWIIVEWYRQ